MNFTQIINFKKEW